MARPSTLPEHPRDLALNVLKKNKKPMSAYQLLAALKPHGIQGPPVIYRALKALEKKGAVHKIQSINSYIACHCHASHTHSITLLSICEGCHDVEELHDSKLMRHFEQLRSMAVNISEHAVIELPVLCRKCAKH